jgi:hypothetical protein
VLGPTAAGSTGPDVAVHDADVLTRRFAHLGYKVEATPIGEGMRLRFGSRVDGSLVSRTVGQCGVLAFHLVADERLAYDAIAVVDQVVSGVGQSDGFSLMRHLTTADGDFAVDEADFHDFGSLLDRGRSHITDGFVFAFGPLDSTGGASIRRLYMLKAAPEVARVDFQDARPSLHTGSDPPSANSWCIDGELSNDCRLLFGEATGRNIGRRLAIVLDGVVLLAPVVQTRIPDGRFRISGPLLDAGEARSLAAVLAGGTLEAGWRVENAVPDASPDMLWIIAVGVLVLTGVALLEGLVRRHAQGIGCETTPEEHQGPSSAEQSANTAGDDAQLPDRPPESVQTPMTNPVPGNVATCKSCGASMRTGANFCASCGKRNPPTG